MSTPAYLLAGEAVQTINVDVELTFGAILLGTCVGLMLYGMTIYQTCQYYGVYKYTDAGILKMTVLILFLADSMHSAICVHICYYYLVQSQARHSVLEYGVWSLRILAPVTQIIVTVVQGFYLRRIRLLGKSNMLVQAAVVVLMLSAIAATLVITVTSFMIASLSEWAEYAWLAAVPFVFTLVADAVLTSTLILFLHQSRTGLRQTDSLLNTLIVYTVNTGLLTSTLSIACLIFAIIQPSNFIYIALNMPTAKSYTNSMLAVLNSRRALANRACAIGGDLGSFCMSSTPASRTGRSCSGSLDCHSIAFRQVSDATCESDYERVRRRAGLEVQRPETSYAV